MIDFTSLFELATICKIALALLSVCTICIVNDSIVQATYYVWNWKARRQAIQEEPQEEQPNVMENFEDDGK